MGTFSAQPAHLAHGFFTTAMGEKEREGQGHMFEQLLGGGGGGGGPGFLALGLSEFEKPLIWGCFCSAPQICKFSPVDQALLYGSRG